MFPEAILRFFSVYSLKMTSHEPRYKKLDPYNFSFKFSTEFGSIRPRLLFLSRNHTADEHKHFQTDTLGLGMRKGCHKNKD